MSSGPRLQCYPTFMPSLPTKEIRIPSQLDREERERRGMRPPRSLSGVLLRTTYAALITGIISFFVLTALSIAALAAFGLLSHRTPNFPNAYRHIGAPGALVVFLAAWIFAFVVFRQEMTNR